MVAFTEPHWSDAVGFYLALGFVKYGSDAEDIHYVSRYGMLEYYRNCHSRAYLCQIFAYRSIS